MLKNPQRKKNAPKKEIRKKREKIYFQKKHKVLVYSKQKNIFLIKQKSSNLSVFENIHLEFCL